MFNEDSTVRYFYRWIGDRPVLVSVSLTTYCLPPCIYASFFLSITPGFAVFRLTAWLSVKCYRGIAMQRPQDGIYPEATQDTRLEYQDKGLEGLYQINN
jgi:hypothetical protein